jgi:aspartyl-tRNA(Asn)/glutamyl-tRNA(Gln) amidotransferase subunit B
MLENDKDPNELIKEMDATQISDESSLLALVNETLNEFPQSIEDYKNGKDRAVGFIVGQIMKKSKGKANPALTNKLVIEELKRR